MCMRTSDFEFDNQKRSDGYIYINEDKLEMEIMENVRFKICKRKSGNCKAEY